MHALERCCLYAFLAVAAAGQVGCMVPVDGADVVQEGRPAEPFVPPETPASDIVHVFLIYPTVPWLVFDDQGGGVVDGFTCSAYLISPVYDPVSGKVHEKGVFGTGTIVVEMYRLDRDAAGGEISALVQTWELPPDKAMKFRGRKPKLLGWGYGLRLKWDKDVKVAGEDVAIVVKYVRDDGRVVPTRRKQLHVPSRGL